MSNINAPAAGRLLAQLPEGGTAELVQLGEAVDRLAAALGCIAGEAAEHLAGAIAAHAVDVYVIRGPNAYAMPATEATVWQAAAGPATAPPTSGRRGFLAPGAWGSSAALATPAPLLVVRRGVASHVAGAGPVRQILVGTAGLCTLIRAAGGMAQPGAALARHPAAVRRDALARMTGAPGHELSAAGAGAATWPAGHVLPGQARAKDLAAQSLIEVERWGAKYSDEAEPRPLCRLGDLVRGRVGSECPVRVAAAEVLRVLEATPPPGGWFILRRGDRARAIRSDDYWRPPSPHIEGAGWCFIDGDNPFRAIGGGLHGDIDGPPGLLACLRSCWVERAEDTAALDAWPAGAVAILQGDAVALFGAPATAAGLVASDAAADGAAVQGGEHWVVQPAGGCWPHSKGPWTDAEREAAFLMRHKHKRPDSDLVRVIGVRRQAIDQQIGGAHKTVARAKSPSWPDKWQPSADLLRECGLALQPLQALQATAAGTR